MGHTNLGYLPKTYRWRQVIEHLTDGAEAGEIADASFHAAQTGLRLVATDNGFAHVLLNIFEFTEAARSKDFISGLKERGFDLPDRATALDVVASFGRKTERDLIENRALSDAAEIAKNSFHEALLQRTTVNQLGIFEASSTDIRDAVGRGLRGREFEALMHGFYASFVQKYLKYYLSRELPNHVGNSRRLKNLDDHAQFNKEFDLHVNQTVRIAKEFTPGWFGKASFEGRIDVQSVRAYAHIAFKKIAKDFAKSEGADG